MAVGDTALNALCLGLLIVYLSPLLLGDGESASLTTILAQLWPALWAGLTAVVVLVLLSVVPFVGAFVASSPPISSFLTGMIIFHILSRQLVYRMLGNWDQASSVYPGLWICTGLLAVSWIVSRLALLPLGLILCRYENTDLEQLGSVVVRPAIGMLASLLPLFMYMSYVRLAIQQIQSHLH
jgi:hypothetical protein